jgi:quinol monooxygenase YgiN
MDTKALYVSIEADAGKEEEVATFLTAALEPVEQEPDTQDWYAARFGKAEFAIFDTFPGNTGRIKHLLGRVGRGLVAKTVTDLEGLPDIEPGDVLAAKTLPPGSAPAYCLHVPLTARDGQEQAVEQFLIGGKPLVDAEPGTLSWYAVKLGSHDFAIIDFFADEAGREAHLQGKVAAALMEQASSLFADPPQIRRGSVLASKAGGRG